MEHNLVGLLESYSCIKDGRKIVFFTKYGDWVEVDSETGKAKVMESVQNYQEFPFMVFCTKGEFYRIDGKGNILYKKGSGKWMKFDRNNMSSETVCLAGQIEDKLFILYANGILYYSIDVEKKTYDYSILFSDDKVRPIVEHEGYIYMQETDRVLVSYSILTSTVKKYELEESVGVIQHICVVNNDELLILNNKNQIFRYNINTSCEKVCELANQDELYWGRIHCVNNEIVVLPWRHDTHIYTYNLETKILKIENIPSYVDFWKGDLLKFVRCYEDESIIIYPCRATNCLLIISKCNRKMHWLKLDVGENVKDILIRLKDFVLKEDTVSLEEFIYLIQQ